MAWGAMQNVVQAFFGRQLISNCQEILLIRDRGNYAKLYCLSDCRFHRRGFRRHLETARALQVLRHGREMRGFDLIHEN
jgi:hypothetical protein